MKSAFDKWWIRVKLPWWVFGNGATTVNMRHDDLRKLCKKAYDLGRKEGAK